MAESRTLGRVVSEARARLRAAGLATPDLDAALLAGHAFGLDRAGLMLRANDAASHEATGILAALLDRRCAGEPVHRILGRRPFHDHEFELSPETLEPRPDTEVVVELAARALRESAGGAPIFADIGAGSGAIGVSLLALFPQALCLAVDLSPGALLTARRNAEAAGVSARFLPVAADYLNAVAGPLDLIVSNPPYIASSHLDALPVEVRGHDPMLALDGGADGLDAYRELARGLGAMAAPPRDVVFEIGEGQEPDVSAIMSAAGYDAHESAVDLGGHLRGLWFRSGVCR